MTYSPLRITVAHSADLSKDTFSNTPFDEMQGTYLVVGLNAAPELGDVRKK